VASEIESHLRVLEQFRSARDDDNGPESAALVCLQCHSFVPYAEFMEHAEQHSAMHSFMLSVQRALVSQRSINDKLTELTGRMVEFMDALAKSSKGVPVRGAGEVTTAERPFSTGHRGT
jgi:hypothetical protein